MNKKIAIIAAIIAAAGAMILVTYGQVAVAQEESQRVIESEVSENIESVLIDTILPTIQNMTISFFAIHADGRLQVTSDNGTSLNLADETRVETYHPYTPENGYVYKDNIVYAPNGTRLFG
jgi:hypothetical protein